ncbi:uncharacterized protein ARMOST_06169 [Armillaria ostoyae]|uniref:Uncharacterized protein n=1 Tax=Armillaria ostoyae TaxID=47428 RepID=A0A284R283_ARMOS|nr:uncharacterized protein ARMOST_06169 [Armillaria ostoyae]
MTEFHHSLDSPGNKKPLFPQLWLPTIQKASSGAHPRDHDELAHRGHCRQSSCTTLVCLDSFDAVFPIDLVLLSSRRLLAWPISNPISLLGHILFIIASPISLFAPLQHLHTPL